MKTTYCLLGLYGTEWRMITRRTGQPATTRKQITRALQSVKAYRARRNMPALEMKIVPAG